MTNPNLVLLLENYIEEPDGVTVHGVDRDLVTEHASTHRSLEVISLDVGAGLPDGISVYTKEERPDTTSTAQPLARVQSSEIVEGGVVERYNLTTCLGKRKIDIG